MDMKEPQEGDLRVWWIPQIPGKSFTVAIPDLKTGLLLTEVLADYDLFQLENNIKPDYSNAGGIQQFEIIEDGEPGDWFDVDYGDIYEGQ